MPSSLCRGRLVAALALLTLATGAQASTATYRVTVMRGASTVIDQTMPVPIGTVSQIRKAADVPVRGVACTGSVAGGERQERDGVAHGGVTVRLQPVALAGGEIQTVVALADAEFVRPVAISAGGCTGHTAAMLKYDSSASFDLRRKAAGTLHVGAYAVHVELLDAPSPAPALAKGAMAI